MADFQRPEPVSYPSPLINPMFKDKKYDIQVAQAIYYQNWQIYNTPYGNYSRDRFIDNRYWARGQQTPLPFAVRPPAKNDHTKNPLLNHIDFSAVNEMVKYCDIFVSMLEENDFDCVATAINPAAAALRENIMADAEAYRQLRPVYEKVDKIAGTKVSPNNPIEYDFETKQELDIFFQIGFKLKEEMLVEIGNEVILNESDWRMIRKLLCEDFRDCGFGIVSNEVDTNNRVRVQYRDPINSGWEEFRGHYLSRMSRFWTIEMKTGAQIIAESGGELNEKDMMTIAMQCQGKFGNPQIPTNMTAQATATMYVNTDSNFQNYFYDSWKFPVLECWWEDWDIMKYRAIHRTSDNYMESFMPVDFNYQPKNGGQPYTDKPKVGRPVEKRVSVKESHVHHYRQCKWVIGTDVAYRCGRVPNCPRNPYDIRYALSPIKIYRATGAPYSQRAKPIAKQMQNAWYKFQNEVARTRPSGVAINVRALDNITTLDGKKIKRYHLLELFNEEGTVLYSDRGARDDLGNTVSSEPFKPAPPIDVMAMQRWMDVINFCSMRMQQELGINEFVNASTPNAEISATAAKAAVGGVQNVIQQYVDALGKLSEEIAIDNIGKLQMILRNGFGESYVSSIGASLLMNVPLDGNITLFSFGIKVQARPTAQQRLELKAEIRKAFSGLGDPTQGSPYLADLLRLEQMIDSGVNMKVIALIASYLQAKNTKAMQEQQNQTVMLQAKVTQDSAAAATQNKIAEAAELAKIEVDVYNAKIDADIRLAQAQSQFKTQNQIETGNVKSQNKKQEKAFENTLQ